jgi:hypothetical protein
MFDTYSAHCIHYKHGRKRRNSRNIGSTHGIRRRQDYGWFPSKSIESKGQAWHDRHIKRNNFKEGVILYESKYLHHTGKFRMHWLGPYEINSIIDGGVVKL